MLPPICASCPAERRMWAISAVVVDLPLVPVMATKGASGQLADRARQNSSTSPMTSTPAALALPTVQCGSGWVSGTPGASTRAANRLQSASLRSSTRKPAAAAASRLRAVSSAATTVAPPASSARQEASPERPRPNTATVWPANVVTGVMAAVSPKSACGALCRACLPCMCAHDRRARGALPMRAGGRCSIPSRRRAGHRLRRNSVGGRRQCQPWFASCACS